MINKYQLCVIYGLDSHGKYKSIYLTPSIVTSKTSKSGKSSLKRLVPVQKSENEKYGIKSEIVQFKALSSRNVITITKNG